MERRSPSLVTKFFTMLWPTRGNIYFSTTLTPKRSLIEQLVKKVTADGFTVNFSRFESAKNPTPSLGIKLGTEATADGFNLSAFNSLKESGSDGALRSQPPVAP